MTNDASLKTPFAKSFAGHETFSLRFSWLKKGVDHLLAQPGIFRRDDAHVLLGVGKNMVNSIRHWCIAARVVEEIPGTRGRELHPTELGTRLLGDKGWDPFLEDDATLWLIHWNLASAGTRAATWYWGFNRLREHAFTRQSMTDALAKGLQVMGWTDIASYTLRRDVDCFVRTYLSPLYGKSRSDDAIECPLTGLELLVEEPDGEGLRFRVGPKASLPPSHFAYALVQFWNSSRPTTMALDFRDIMTSEGSPALVFKLDEDSVLAYMDRIREATLGQLQFEDTPLVRRAVKTCRSEISTLPFVEAYYACR